MKSILLIAAILAGSAAHAFPVAQCQVELLKAATNALQEKFKENASGVEQFNSITINFNEPLRPKAVFFGDGKPGARKYCLVQVLMKMPEESFPADHCPKYEVEEFDTNCP